VGLYPHTKHPFPCRVRPICTECIVQGTQFTFTRGCSVACAVKPTVSTTPNSAGISHTVSYRDLRVIGHTCVDSLMESKRTPPRWWIGHTSVAPMVRPRLPAAAKVSVNSRKL